MSTETLFRACRWCRARYAVRHQTDGAGRVVEEGAPCPCEGRRARSLCIDCGDSAGGRSWRCEPCKVTASHASSKRWRDNNPDTYRRIQNRENAKRRRPEERARIRERERARRSTPEARRRRAEQRRRRLLADGGRKRAEQRRRYKARNPEKVRESQRRANRKRAAAKREYMHRWATKYVGEGRKPKCRRCGEEVEWNGLGRPRLDCFSCRPMDSRERRARAR